MIMGEVVYRDPRFVVDKENGSVVIAEIGLGGSKLAGTYMPLGGEHAEEFLRRLNGYNERETEETQDLVRLTYVALKNRRIGLSTPFPWEPPKDPQETSYIGTGDFGV